MYNAFFSVCMGKYENVIVTIAPTHPNHDDGKEIIFLGDFTAQANCSQACADFGTECKGYTYYILDNSEGTPYQGKCHGKGPKGPDHTLAPPSGIIVQSALRVDCYEF